MFSRKYLKVVQASRHQVRCSPPPQPRIRQDRASSFLAKVLQKHTNQHYVSSVPASLPQRQSVNK